MASPFVEYLLGETEKVVEMHPGPVVEDGVTGEAPKDLMLNGLDNADVSLGMAIQDGLEVHVEATVAAHELPRLDEGVRRDLELDKVELVNPAVPEDDVLAGGAGVAKPIADVEPEGMPVHTAGAGTPVPRVAVRPDAPTPVEDAG